MSHDTAPIEVYGTILHLYMGPGFPDKFHMKIPLDAKYKAAITLCVSIQTPGVWICHVYMRANLKKSISLYRIQPLLFLV